MQLNYAVQLTHPFFFQGKRRSIPANTNENNSLASASAPAGNKAPASVNPVTQSTSTPQPKTSGGKQAAGGIQKEVAEAKVKNPKNTVSTGGRQENERAIEQIEAEEKVTKPKLTEPSKHTSASKQRSVSSVGEHGHSHDVPDSCSSVAVIVMLGDGLHNFTDGLAIGKSKFYI